MRKKAGMDEAIPAVIPNEMSSQEFRQNWARLIQKVYKVDPLLCPKCQGTMKNINFIEDLDIIEKILRHLDFWDTRNHDPPEPETHIFLNWFTTIHTPRIRAIDYRKLIFFKLNWWE